MKRAGLELGPREGPGVRYGVDPADPERFLVQGSRLRAVAAVALAFGWVFGLGLVQAVPPNGRSR